MYIVYFLYNLYSNTKSNKCNFDSISLINTTLQIENNEAFQYAIFTIANVEQRGTIPYKYLQTLIISI